MGRDYPDPGDARVRLWLNRRLMHIDVFCRVVDNWGDAGVCARLAADLAARGHVVRLAIDDAAPLAWMRPEPRGFDVIDWSGADWAGAGLMVETFGADPPPRYLAGFAEHSRASGRQPPWVNLEYLSAEPYVERNHGLPSPLATGPAAGLMRHFFYPGFGARGGDAGGDRDGGLLREPDYADRRRAFDAATWRVLHGVPGDAMRVVSVFCYEPAPLADWLAALARSETRTHLLVAAGRAAEAVRQASKSIFPSENGHQPRKNGPGVLSISYQPLVSQAAFDERLWASDFNLVRGEDSLARAALAGKPFLWQAYPQEDGAQHPKIEALMGRLELPASACAAHAAWNGSGTAWPDDLAPFPDTRWTAAARRAGERLARRSDLATRLVEFAAGAHGRASSESP